MKKRQNITRSDKKALLRCLLLSEIRKNEIGHRDVEGRIYLLKSGRVVTGTGFWGGNLKQRLIVRRKKIWNCWFFYGWIFSNSSEYPRVEE